MSTAIMDVKLYASFFIISLDETTSQHDTEWHWKRQRWHWFHGDDELSTETREISLENVQNV